MGACAGALDARAWVARPVANCRTLFRNRDLCAGPRASTSTAIAEYLERGGQSRGSFLVVNPRRDRVPAARRAWRFSLNPPGAFVDSHILEVSVDDATSTSAHDVGGVQPDSEPDDVVRDGVEGVQGRNGVRLTQEIKT